MHLKHLLLAAIFFCIATVPGISQKQAQNWYFGMRAGVSFATGQPVAITNGVLETSEGCAVMSNKTTGALMFYTDGVSVWTRNHQTMPNGTGLFGNSTATQSALIVPHPGNPNRFFVFSPGSSEVDSVISERLVYSIVDMSLNNGFGDVISKNTVLMTSGMSEKLTATYDCTSNGFWVLAHHHSSPIFYAFRITTAGLTTTPVTSTAGVFNQQYTSMIGQMKFSPNGKKIALSSFHPSTSLRGGFELFNFNFVTGAVSQGVTLRTNERFYGASFSPDSKVLYGVVGEMFSGIDQFNITLPTATQIINSRVRITSFSQTSSLQIGPDGKIYVPRGTSLACIEQPNSLGTACDFRLNRVGLSGRTSQFSLPNFIDNIFNTGDPELTCTPPTAAFDAAEVCEGGTITFTDKSTNSPTSWEWAFSGGSPATFSGKQPPAIRYMKAGVYNVTLTVSNEHGSSTATRQVTVHPPPKPIVIRDTSVCIETTLSIGGTAATGVTYTWTPSDRLDNPSAANPRATFPEAGKFRYIVKAVNTWGCEAYDTVNITVIPNPIAIAGDDKLICEGTTIAIGGQKADGLRYEWNPKQYLSDPTLASPIATPPAPGKFRYIVKVVNTWGCEAYDTVNITVIPNPVAIAGDDKLICEGTSIAIGGQKADGLRYEWNPKQYLSDPTLASPIATLPKTTQFILTVTNATGCKAYDTVLVSTEAYPNTFTKYDTRICPGGSASIGMDPQAGITYLWTPVEGLSNPTMSRTVAAPDATTTYTLTARTLSGNCISETSVTVFVRGVDGTWADSASICAGSSTQLWAKGGSVYQWEPAYGLDNPSSASPVAAPQKTTTYRVIISDGQCADTGYVTVNVEKIDVADAGSDITLCSNASGQIGTSGKSGMRYTWTPETGLSNPAISSPTVLAKELTGKTNQFIVTSWDVRYPECTTSDTVLVHIGEIDAYSSADTSICKGDFAQLKAWGGAEYLWMPSTGLDNNKIDKPIASPSVTTTYTVYVISGDCIDSTTVRVFVADNVIADAGQEKAICAGESVSIGSTSIEGYTYLWSPAEGLNNPSAASPVATPRTTTVYTLYATNSAGCSAVDSTIVRVSSLPVITVSADNDTICAGNSARLQATADTKDGITFKWFPADGLSSDDAIANPVVQPLKTTTYHVIAFKNENGVICQTEDSITITVINPPVLFTSQDTAICLGNSTLLKAAGGVTYKWSPAAGLSSVYIPEPTATPDSSTTYTVEITDINNCVYTRQIHVGILRSEEFEFKLSTVEAGVQPGEMLPVTVHFKTPEKPVYSFEARLQYDPKLLQLGQSALIITGADQSWSGSAQETGFGEVVISASGVTPLDMALVTVQFNIFLAPVDTSAVSLDIIRINNLPFKDYLGECIQAVASGTSIDISKICGGDLRMVNISPYTYELQRVHPNPVQQNTEVSFTVGLPGFTTIILYNSAGEEILTLAKGEYQAGKHTVTLPASDLSSGVYFYRMMSGEFSDTKPLIISK